MRSLNLIGVAACRTGARAARGVRDEFDGGVHCCTLDAPESIPAGGSVAVEVRGGGEYREQARVAREPGAAGERP